MLDPEFWRGRRIFLTGHTGFKGVWLTLWLRRMGAEVTGYSIDVPTQPSLYEATRIKEEMRDLRGDINDRVSLTAAIKEARPEVLLHLAAQSLVRTSYADPVGTFKTNILGTANVLDSARGITTLKVILIVTSDKCYENREWEWGYRESDPMGGYDPYSSSKGAAELVTASMRRSFFGAETYGNHGVAIASARSGNVIGGGDWSTDRLLPDLVRAFSSGVPAQIRSPNATRPWQFVLDPLAGYLLLSERLWADGLRFAEAWNFGPDPASDRTVGEVATIAQRRWGPDAAIQVVKKPAPHEALSLRLDTSKSRRRLGWQPKVSFLEAIDLTVDWYRSYYHRSADSRAECERQIGKWLSLS